MSIAGLKYYLSSRANMFDFFASRNMLNWMSDEAFLKRKFKLRMGYELNLDDPKTFNEKLQWLKLHDRNPLYTKLVDKYEVRKYIAEKIGEEYLIPLVGGPWNSPEEIDFDLLPDQFVLKCTHDSGGVVICKDKSKLDIPAVKAEDFEIPELPGLVLHVFFGDDPGWNILIRPFAVRPIIVALKVLCKLCLCGRNIEL